MTRLSLRVPEVVTLSRTTVYASFESTSPDVATCSLDGLGTAQAAGTTNIVAHYDTAGIWTLDAYGADCTWEPFSTGSSAGCTVLPPAPPEITITDVNFVPEGVLPNGSFNVRVYFSATTNCPDPQTSVNIELIDHSNPSNISYAVQDRTLSSNVTPGGSASVSFQVNVGATAPNGRIQFKARILSSSPSTIPNPSDPNNAININYKPADGFITTPGICVGEC